MAKHLTSVVYLAERSEYLLDLLRSHANTLIRYSDTNPVPILEVIALDSGFHFDYPL